MSLDKPLQRIETPNNFTVIDHEFYTYDPATEYSAEASNYYLTEDLFQVKHGPTELVVDLGWYGNVNTNKGQFEMRVVMNDYWDEPVSTILAKSQSEMTEIVNKTLEAINTGIFGDE